MFNRQSSMANKDHVHLPRNLGGATPKIEQRNKSPTQTSHARIKPRSDYIQTNHREKHIYRESPKQLNISSDAVTLTDASPSLSPSPKTQQKRANASAKLARRWKFSETCTNQRTDESFAYIQDRTPTSHGQLTSILSPAKNAGRCDRKGDQIY